MDRGTVSHTAESTNSTVNRCGGSIHFFMLNSDLFFWGRELASARTRDELKLKSLVSGEVRVLI